MPAVDTSMHGGLQRLDGFSFVALSSSGCEQKAVEFAGRASRAADFLSRVLRRTPEFALLVLSRDDWAAKRLPPVYGIPRSGRGNVFLAGEKAPFWAELADSIRSERPELAAELERVYATPSGLVDLRPFFDLLVVHELAHCCHQQVPCRFPRDWLAEFFANLSLHAYVAADEPESMAALATFPALYVKATGQRFAHFTLSSFDREPQSITPPAIAWYQCRLHAAAGQAYRTRGVGALQRLWDEFCRDDAQLNGRLAEIVGQEAADMMAQ